MTKVKSLFRQTQHETEPTIHISDCHFKHLQYKAIPPFGYPPQHLHTEFEIHLVIKGNQVYKVFDEEVTVRENKFLIIPPGAPHQNLSQRVDSEKYAFVFNADYKPDYPYFVGTPSETVMQNLHFITEELRQPQSDTIALLNNRLRETILLLFRLAGYSNFVSKRSISAEDDNRLSLAKAYIADNIANLTSAEEVASYCYLSLRQMTRLFNKYENMSLSTYIQHLKMHAIQADLLADELSIREISEKYGYNDEHYFNRAFKAHFGTPPGQYRRIHKE